MPGVMEAGRVPLAPQLPPGMAPGASSGPGGHARQQIGPQRYIYIYIHTTTGLGPRRNRERAGVDHLWCIFELL